MSGWPQPLFLKIYPAGAHRVHLDARQVDSPRILHPQFPSHPAIKISLTTFVNSSFLFPLIQTSKDQLLQIVGTDPNGGISIVQCSDVTLGASYALLPSLE